MNYLVTGAAGFIAGAVVQKLLDEGHNCMTIDNLSTGTRSCVPKGCNYVYGDASDPILIHSLEKEKFDAIIHMAGQSSGEVSFDNPVYDLDTNVQSTILLLQLAKKIGCPKFIYASSMSVYGEPNPPKCDEQSFTVPKSFYAVGKMASENYMRIYSNYGIACTALRFFNVYGVGQNLDNLRQGMASIFLAMAIKNHHIHVKGSKDRFRDFVYIDDVVRSILLSIKREVGYECFNVCSGVPTRVDTVVGEIIGQLPYDVSVEYRGGTPGDQFGIYGDNSKIKATLGWEPTIKFSDGMKKMIEWAREKMGDI